MEVEGRRVEKVERVEKEYTDRVRAETGLSLKSSVSGCCTS